MTILGELDVDFPNGALHTHRTSYFLEGIRVSGVKQPFLPAAILIGVGLTGIWLSFRDILYAHELTFITLIVMGAGFAGWNVAKLELRSYELRSGDQLSDVVWGRFGSLNAKRREIIQAVASIRGGRS